MQIKLDPSAYSSKFYDVIHSWDRYIIAYGGRGSSKTESFFIKYLIELFEPYYFKLAYINKEASGIRDNQYQGFKRVAKRIGLYDKLKFYDGDYRIVNPKTENMLIPKGMDDPEKTKGLDDVTAIWWDEINKGDLEDFQRLNELLRSPAAKYLQFAMSFNPVHIEHWLRTTFFHPDNSHEVHPDFRGQMLLNRSTYRDNEFIDQQAYAKTLIMSAMGNPNSLRVNIEGDWGLPENNSPWLYNFDETKHVREVPFLPLYPVYISFDFNVDPFACTIWQMSPHKGGKDSFVHCVDEISGKYKIEEMCDILNQRYGHCIKYITGDRSGQNEDVGRNQSLYQMIAGRLGVSNKNLHLNTHNLEHADSRILCNAMFFYYPNLAIHPKCKGLIDDCKKATIDEKGKDPSKLKKDRDGFKMDSFDSMRYTFQTYYLDFVKNTYMKFVKK